jgi:hypothetical protein
MKFLVPIDLAKNELQNARVQNLSTAPANPEAGQIYFDTEANVLNFYDGTGWVATGDISAASIDALSDVEITSVGDRQFLVYDGNSSKWVNSTINVGDLNNVDTSGAASGNALVFDGTNWVPATIAYELGELTDVVLSTPASGEVLYFDGEDWVNEGLDTDLVPEGSNLYYTDQRADDRIAAADVEDLANVSTGATDQQVLRYNNTSGKWEPASLDTDSIPEGTNNLYYTDQRADDRADGRIAAATTDNLSEGSKNLYFTNERADNRADDRIAAASIGDLADVDVDSVASGDALVFDGEDWVADGSTYQKVSEKGQADGYASLDSTGKLPTSQLPDLAITDTFVVADEAGRLALDVQRGDVAVQTDTGETYILAGDDPSDDGDWVLLAEPGASVRSVSGTAPISSTGGTNPTISLDNLGVTEGKIADGAVTETKLATALANKINAKTDKVSATIGDNSATSFTITHNLGTRDIQVDIYEAATPYSKVIADVDHATTNAVTVKFAVAPKEDEYRVVVVG